jgi:hypothetical protein
LKDWVFEFLATVLSCLFVTLPIWSMAHESGAPIDTSQIPLEGNSANDFVPPGWVIEGQVSGDLNKDSLADVALKLIEDKPAQDGENLPLNRRRLLLVLFKGKDGKFSRVAVADRLLQDTCDGGAFHAFCTGPANVRIQNGILIVNQDHGSRNVIEDTFRFRYEALDKRFVLIGLDKVDSDRLTGVTISRSTNFLTGEQILQRSRFSESKGRNFTESSVKQRVPRQKVFIEQVDHEKY